MELRASLLFHHERTRAIGDLGRVHAVMDERPHGGKDKGKGKGKPSAKGKGKSKSRSGSADGRKGSGKGSPKGKGKGKGTPRGSPSRASSEEKERRKKEGLCYECGAKGHLAKDCPKRQKLRCSHCGKQGHTAAQCRQNAVHAAESVGESEPEDEQMMMTLTSRVYSEEQTLSISTQRTPESLVETKGSLGLGR